MTTLHRRCSELGTVALLSLCVNAGAAQDTYTDAAEASRRVPAEQASQTNNDQSAEANDRVAEAALPNSNRTRSELGSSKPATRMNSDRAIADAIEDELRYDSMIAVHGVDVAVKGGRATLSGAVDTILAKERASALAATVRGVKDVDNRLAVEPRVQREPDEIESMVTQALLMNPATESYNVDVTAIPDGKVVLGGTVSSWAERELSERVAKSVVGVRTVQNDIELTTQAPRADRAVKAEVEQMLRADAYVDPSNIQVNVSDGVVELRGRVGSVAEKNRAVMTAATSGVGRVDASKLTVTADDQSDRGQQRAAVALTDREIGDAVRMRLKAVPEVNAAKIVVSIEDGVATLRGNTETLAARRQALSVAGQTHGVERVQDRLRVRPSGTVSDDELERKLVSALAANPMTEAYEISVDVKRGTARLSGVVDTWFEKGVADRVVAGVNGVRSVQNRLDVERDADRLVFDPYVDTWSVYDFDWYRPAPVTIWKRDSAIAADIERELLWSPFVDAREIDVEVNAGIVTLTGQVDTWAEAAAAQENALEGGASSVINRLEIGRGV